MNFLLDPNVAFLILLGGILLGLMAIVTPGTGLFEVGAFFCLVLAGYAVYNLSFVNWWAMLLIVFSLIPFVYATQKPKREAFLGISILLLLVGSIFLFAADGWLPAVNPLVAFLGSGSMAGFLWIIVRKSVQAAAARPVHDLDALVGQMGDARTVIKDDGSVYVQGEIWTARSEGEIPLGSRIRVVRREGFILVVEKDKSDSHN